LWTCSVGDQVLVGLNKNFVSIALANKNYFGDNYSFTATVLIVLVSIHVFVTIKIVTTVILIC